MEVAEVWEAANWWSVGTPGSRHRHLPAEVTVSASGCRVGEGLGFERDLALIRWSARTH